MKKILLALVLCLHLIMPNSAMCGDNQSTSYNVNFFIGQKMLDDDDWEPIEDQFEIGVMFDLGEADWPVNIAVDILRSSGDDTYPFTYNNTVYDFDVEGNTIEINVGIRKIWQDTKFQPFIGGGLALIMAEIEASLYSVSESEEDSGIGLWLEFGAKYLLTEQFSIGLDLRYSKAEVTFGDVDGEAGGMHIGAILGYHY